MDQHCYIISYDLCTPGYNYDNLYNVLKQFPNWGKLTESTWAVVSDLTYVQIRDLLLSYIDSNDRLVVILSGRQAAWSNLLANDNWVKTNLVR